MASYRRVLILLACAMIWIVSGCGSSSNEQLADGVSAGDGLSDSTVLADGSTLDQTAGLDLQVGLDGSATEDLAQLTDTSVAQDTAGGDGRLDASATPDTNVSPDLALVDGVSPSDTAITPDTSGPFDTTIADLNVPLDTAVIPDLAGVDASAGKWQPGSVGSIGTPFDYATGDNVGPTSHSTLYGAKPKIALVVNPDGSIDVAWQDVAGKRVVITRLQKSSGQLVAVEHLVPGGLELLGGFTKDPSGNLYLMTALNENLQAQPQPAKVQRDGVVSVAKYDPAGKQLFTTDLRTDINGATNTAIYDPLTAGTGRLLFAGGKLMTSFSQHGEYDAQVSSRHQWHINIRLDATTGALEKYYWGISHSFDQQLLHDGTNFISVALGDASLRGIGLSKLDKGGFKVAFAIKGGDSKTGGGYNNTFTRLGNLRKSSNGYLLLFASENDPTSEGSTVNASRNLVMLHVVAGFDSVAQGPDGKYDVVISDTASQNDKATTLDVTINDYWGKPFVGKNRGLVWLTAYSNPATENAERPKLVPLAGDQFLVLWEKWNSTSYVETLAMVIDEYGAVVRAATSIGSYRLYRGDDLVAHDGGAAWLIGDGKNKRFRYLHVSAELGVTTYLIP